MLLFAYSYFKAKCNTVHILNSCLQTSQHLAIKVKSPQFLLQSSIALGNFSLPSQQGQRKYIEEGEGTHRANPITIVRFSNLHPQNPLPSPKQNYSTQIIAKT
jgi:hypothetical protein